MSVLYERWRQVAQERRNESALRDLATGEAWTFAQLAGAVEAFPHGGSAMVCPQGHSAQFVIEVLRGWRIGAVVCPLEPGQKPPVIPPPPPHIAHLKLTSATTGQSRVVAFTGEQLAADAEHILPTMRLRPEWPNLAVISMAHSYGFSNLVLPLALFGVPLIVAPSPLPEAMRRAAQLFPDITLPAVPALWRAWHEAAAIPNNVRLAISAGAPLPVSLEQAVFAATGVKVHNFYGSSECGGIAYDAAATPRQDDACVGQPMQQVRLAINETGCMMVQSRAVAETYWPEASPALGNGCFQTSDLAEVVDGQVFLRGRLSDQINVAGRKVSPEQVEHALRQHPGVRDCLVFGVPSPDADRTECIVACVAARQTLSNENLKHFLLDRLPAWQVPREWWLVDSLEANARGKLSRAEWRRKFLERQKMDFPR